MDTLSKGLNLMKSKDWTFILDLPDAYIHVPVLKKMQTISKIIHSMENTLFRAHSSIQRFHENGFCNSSIFTVSEHQNSGLFMRLISSKSATQILSSRSRKMCQSIDFTGVYNKYRKVKFSTQIVFSLSRGQFDLAQGTISPTIERMRKLKLTIQILMKGQNTARDYLHLLGIMASCIEMIPNARLYMRPIQRYLICFCRPVSQNLECIIPLTPHLKSHFQWWLNSTKNSKHMLL